MVLVLTADGQLLAEVTRLPPATASPRAVVRARRQHGLLQYYFGQGGREVLLQEEASAAWRGRIVATHWLPDGRLWYLEAEAAA